MSASSERRRLGMEVKLEEDLIDAVPRRTRSHGGRGRFHGGVGEPRHKVLLLLLLLLRRALAARTTHTTSQNPLSRRHARAPG